VVSLRRAVPHGIQRLLRGCWRGLQSNVGDGIEWVPCRGAIRPKFRLAGDFKQLGVKPEAAQSRSKNLLSRVNRL
jgi:hypothetical protein